MEEWRERCGRLVQDTVWHAGIAVRGGGEKQLFGRRGERGGQTPRERIDARLHGRDGNTIASSSSGGSSGGRGGGQRRFAGARPPVGRVVVRLRVRGARVRVAVLELANVHATIGDGQVMRKMKRECT
jgi:hypothetical protein